MNIIQTPTGYRATIDGTEWSIPNDPGNRFWQMVQQTIADGAQVTDSTQSVPADVNAERERRVLHGSTFSLTSGKVIKLQGDDTTKTNLQALAFAASLRIARGEQDTTTLFRDADDFVHMLTQLELIELWSKSAEFVSNMFKAAWFLKDGPGIPEDYTDDKYWS
jgi:hypothetical protein